MRDATLFGDGVSFTQDELEKLRICKDSIRALDITYVSTVTTEGTQVLSLYFRYDVMTNQVISVLKNGAFTSSRKRRNKEEIINLMVEAGYMPAIIFMRKKTIDDILDFC